MCRGKKKKKNSSCFNNIIPTLTLPLTLRCLFSFSDVEHSRSGQWSYLPLPAPAVFSGRKAQYLRREFFFSPLRPEHFYQVKAVTRGINTEIRRFLGLFFLRLGTQEIRLGIAFREKKKIRSAVKLESLGDWCY